MNNNNYTDYTTQSRAAFLAYLEKERHEMLAAGMSEADIFRMHFGEIDENGKPRKDVYPGDYAVWLSERKHIRPDHKYSYGTPQSLDDIKYEGDWFTDNSAENLLVNIEQTIDIEAILKTLPPKQSALVRALVFDGVTSAEYAAKNGISKAAVSKNLKRIKKVLKLFF